MTNDNQITLDQKKEYFNSFIEEYKENTLLNKQKIIVSELKELIAIFQQLCNMYGIENDILINREIIDINNNDTYSQDDFAEAIYVYIQMFKETMSSFLFPMIENDDNQNEM